MEKTFLQATLKREGDTLEFIASDETLDRQGEVIPLTSWDLKNYKKNPVLLVNHDYKVENIVGKATRLRIEDGALKFNPVFHELTQLAKDVKAMVEEGLLNTVSVGFMPIYPKKNGEQVKNELLEVSFVPVPANPSASRIGKALEDMIGKSVDEVKLKEFLKDVEPEAEEEKPEEKIEEKAVTTEIQSLIFDKEVYKTETECVKWAKDHEFRSDKVDETGESFRLRQLDPSVCEADTMKTIEITDGVKAVTCRTTKGVCQYPVNMPIQLLDLLLADNEKLRKALIKATPRATKAGRLREDTNLNLAVLKHLAKEINGALYKVKKLQD